MPPDPLVPPALQSTEEKTPSGLICVVTRGEQRYFRSFGQSTMGWDHTFFKASFDCLLNPIFVFIHNFSLVN